MVKKFILFFIFFMHSIAYGAVEVESSLSAKQVHPKDTFTLTVTIHYEKAEEVREPRLADLKHFYLTGTQQSQSFHSSGGEVRRKKQYHYILKPKTEGHFTIPAIEVVVSGTLYKTDPVKVEVTKKAPRSSKSSGGSGRGGIMFPFRFPGNLFAHPFFGQGGKGMDDFSRHSGRGCFIPSGVKQKKEFMWGS